MDELTASDKAERVCTIKVVLLSGEVDVLISNLLDQSTYPAEDFSVAPLVNDMHYNKCLM